MPASGPDIEGLVVRSPQRDDIAAIHAMVRRCEAHDRIPLVTPIDEIVEWYDDPRLDHETNSVLVLDRDTVVARSWLLHRVKEGVEEQAILLGEVDGAHRRRGIGTALFGWSEDRAREIFGSSNSGLPAFFRTYQWSFQSDALALYTRHGFQPVRWWFDMIRPLSDPIPPPTPPPGVALGAWDPNLSAAAMEVENAAFEDHWGSAPVSAEAWEHVYVGGIGRRLDLSTLAVAAGEVVGLVLVGVFPEDFELVGRREGWIDVIGVVPAWRKRGIASALIARTLHALSADDLTHGALTVDAANPTGALGLYERLGFRTERESVTYQKEHAG